MGNSESSNPIRNLDKRTARREYREDFIRAITRYRQLHPPPPQSLTKASAGAGAGGMVANWEDNSIKVFVRKRPIFSHEISHDEYDVITCYPSPANPPHIVIHDCRMHTDMKRQFINHHEFQFDEIFDEKAENTLVYEKTAKPLINIACEGGFSTALVYGQTGSGKVREKMCFFFGFFTNLDSFLPSSRPLPCLISILKLLMIFSLIYILISIDLMINH